MSVRICDLNRLLCEIGSCHRFLANHARNVGEMADVVSSHHSFDMASVECTFRLEEYVDAELANGQAYSWSLEIVLSDNSIKVAAEIRRIHDLGQDLVEQIAEREFSDLVQFSTSLVGIVKVLCLTVPFGSKQSG